MKAMANGDLKRRRASRLASSTTGSFDWRAKRYGRILGRDIEKLLNSLREFSQLADELRTLVTSDKAEKFWVGLAKRPQWGDYYLRPFSALIARFVLIADAGKVVREMASAEFPSDHISALEHHLDQVEPKDSAELIPMLFALVGNLEAIGAFSCSMSDLLDRVIKKACVESLARAASIDTAVLALPAAQFYMKALQLTGERVELAAFLGEVGQGPHKRRAPYNELRLIEYLLREQGAFKACSQREIFDLVVNGLKVYGSEEDHADAQKALFALFRKWRLEAGELKF